MQGKRSVVPQAVFTGTVVSGLTASINETPSAGSNIFTPHTEVRNRAMREVAESYVPVTIAGTVATPGHAMLYSPTHPFDLSDKPSIETGVIYPPFDETQIYDLIKLAILKQDLTTLKILFDRTQNSINSSTAYRKDCDDCAEEHLQLEIAEFKHVFAKEALQWLKQCETWHSTDPRRTRSHIIPELTTYVREKLGFEHRVIEYQQWIQAHLHIVFQSKSERDSRFEKKNLEFLQSLNKAFADMLLVVERGLLSHTSSLTDKLQEQLNIYLKKRDTHLAIRDVFIARIKTVFDALCKRSKELLQGENAASSIMYDEMHPMLPWDVVGLFFAHKQAALIRDRNGNSLLHFAVSHNKPVALKWLLEQGIDVKAKNAEGKTAINIAVEKKYPHLLSLLGYNYSAFDSALMQAQRIIGDFKKHYLPKLKQVLKDYPEHKPSIKAHIQPMEDIKIPGGLSEEEIASGLLPPNTPELSARDAHRADAYDQLSIGLSAVVHSIRPGQEDEFSDLMACNALYELKKLGQVVRALVESKALVRGIMQLGKSSLIDPFAEYFTAEHVYQLVFIWRIVKKFQANALSIAQTDDCSLVAAYKVCEDFERYGRGYSLQRLSQYISTGCLQAPLPNAGEVDRRISSAACASLGVGEAVPACETAAVYVAEAGAGTGLVAAREKETVTPGSSRVNASSQTDTVASAGREAVLLADMRKDVYEPRLGGADGSTRSSAKAFSESMTFTFDVPAEYQEIFGIMIANQYAELQRKIALAARRDQGLPPPLPMAERRTLSGDRSTVSSGSESKSPMV